MNTPKPCRISIRIDKDQLEHLRRIARDELSRRGISGATRKLIREGINRRIIAPQRTYR